MHDILQKYADTQDGIFGFLDTFKFSEVITSSLQEASYMQENDHDGSMSLLIDKLLEKCAEGTNNLLLRRLAELRKIQNSIDDNYNEFWKATNRCKCPFAPVDVAKTAFGIEVINDSDTTVNEHPLKNDNFDNVLAVDDGEPSVKQYPVIDSNSKETVISEAPSEDNADISMKDENLKTEVQQVKEAALLLMPPSIDDQNEYLQLKRNRNIVIITEKSAHEEVCRMEEDVVYESDDEKLKIDESGSVGEDFGSQLKLDGIEAGLKAIFQSPKSLPDKSPVIGENYNVD